MSYTSSESLRKQPYEIVETDETWQNSSSKRKLGSYVDDDADADTNPARPIRCIRIRRQFTSLAIIVLLTGWAIYSHLINVQHAVELRHHLPLQQGLREGLDNNLAMDFDPGVNDLLLIKDLDPKHVPESGTADRHGARLIVVGDVHGMKHELVKLLAKLEFNPKRDHLVLAGDLISKGPNSEGVVELAMELGASAVRGNHEDRVLKAYKKRNSKNSEQPLEDSALSGDEKDMALLDEFSHKQIRWLKSLPVILRVGPIEGMGEVVIVHAGLMPGVELRHQDPFAVMNMRTIDDDTNTPSELRQGTPWVKLWNKHQKKLPRHERSTVIYGHDAKRGLVEKSYTKGIDTACVKGGRLTAFVIEGGHKKVRTSLVHVNCKDWE